MREAVHTLIWITAWSSVPAALVPALVRRKREPCEYAHAIVRLLGAEAVFVVLAMALSLDSVIALIRSIGGVPRFLLSTGLNGLVYGAFSLYLSRLPAAFLQPTSAGDRRRVRTETILTVCLLSAAALLTAFNLLAVMSSELVSGPARIASLAGWLAFSLTAAVTIAYAGIAAFRDSRRLPWTKPAAVLFIAFFVCFFAFELLPQLFSAGSDRRLYFFLPLGLIVLNSYLSVNTVRLLMAGPDGPRRLRAQGEAATSIPPGGDPDEIPGLSPRESQIARLLADGKTYKEIASDLRISLSTVQTHVFRIYSKLGVSGKMELFHRLRS